MFAISLYLVLRDLRSSRSRLYEGLYYDLTLPGTARFLVTESAVILSPVIQIPTTDVHNNIKPFIQPISAQIDFFKVSALGIFMGSLLVII